MYFFAIETTRRRLASTSSFLACSACYSPRRIVSSVCFSSAGSCSSASVIAFSLQLLLLDLAQQVLLVLFPQLLLLVLRVEQPIDRFDLALHRLDVFDRLLHLVDQAALHRFGELDLANALRHLDARAHRRPPRPAVLPLVARRRALRRFVELLLQLLRREVRLADRVDLLLHLARALGDALVGDFLVVEDDELADRAVAGVQRVARAG